VLISQGIFSRRTLENQPFPLKASIAYTTLPCANALACDGEVCYRDNKVTFSFNARKRKRSLQIEADHTNSVSLSDALIAKLEFMRN
jgi:hypothetical protein